MEEITRSWRGRVITIYKINNNLYVRKADGPSRCRNCNQLIRKGDVKVFVYIRRGRYRLQEAVIGCQKCILNVARQINTLAGSSSSGYND